MVKKLRFKFVLFSIISIFTLLLIILFTVNIINFSIVGNEADKITLNIANNDGRFTPPVNDPENLMPKSPSRDNPPGSRPEDFATTRYISATYYQAEDRYDVFLEKNSSFNNAQDVIEVVKKLNGEVGWYKNYRYRVFEINENSIRYILLDYYRELGPSFNVLNVSIIVLFIGTILSFIVLFFISKRVVHPFEVNQHRQKRFISDASHELKTPITIISANNEIEEIEKGKSDATEAISTQVNRLTSLVKSLNEIVKIDEVKNIELNEFNISDAAYEICNSFKNVFSTSKKKFEFNIGDNLVYNGDEAKIVELINILLDNANKYSTSYINFSLIREKERIIIKCENDTNNTYPEKYNGELNLVFDRFYRGEDARMKSISGSGIGLSIAQEIVNQHKGRIYANGKGNIFIIKAEI